MHRIVPGRAGAPGIAAIVVAAISLTACQTPVTLFNMKNLGPDKTAPVIARFALISGSPTANNVITIGLDGSDNVGITGWAVDESPTAPIGEDSSWLPGTPASFKISREVGSQKIYAWARDAAGNISEAASLSVDYVAPGSEIVTSWNRKIDGSGGPDTAESTAVDSAGNVYVAGTGNGLAGASGDDWWIKKFSRSGVEDAAGWNKTFSSNGDAADRAKAVAVDSAGNVYVIGTGTNLVGTNPASGIDWWIKKFSPAGVEVTTGWDKKLSSPGTADDYAVGIAVDSSDNVYVVGTGMNLSGTTGADWWIRKFSSAGVEDTTNWNKRFDDGTAGVDRARSVAVDSSGSVYVVGYGTNLVNSISGSDWWIKKFSASGIEETANWNKKIDDGTDGADRAESVAVDSSGHVYVVGCGADVAGANDGSDWWIKRFSSSGAEDTASWDKRFDGGTGGDDCAQSVAIGASGEVYVAGYGDNLVTAASGSDWWIKRFSSSGTEDTADWNKKYDDGTAGSDRAESVATDAYGNVYVAGEGANLISGTSSSDWWIKKFVDSGT